MNDAIAVLFEPHEWRKVIEGLMIQRVYKLDACGIDESAWDTPGEDPETESLMRHFMTHIGLPDAKLVVPEAYALCFPPE